MIRRAPRSTLFPYRRSSDLLLLARELKKTKIIAETGAGQHGVATATVCALMGMECVIYMGEVDIERQRPNVERMRILGAEVRPATSGSRTLKDATNEAMRHWINKNTLVTKNVINFKTMNKYSIFKFNKDFMTNGTFLYKILNSPKILAEFNIYI